jgi:AmiR/NasT family two-component response regulator
MRSIVIVSNQPDTVDLLCQFLKQSACSGNVEVFGITQDALERIHAPERLRPTMVFVELSGLPDAPRFIDWIKTSGTTRSLSLVVIADEKDNTLVPFLEAIGADAILRKPLQFESVQRIVGMPEASPVADER